MDDFKGIGCKNQGAILKEIGEWQQKHSMRFFDEEFLDLRERMAKIYRLGVADGIQKEFS